MSGVFEWWLYVYGFCGGCVDEVFWYEWRKGDVGDVVCLYVGKSCMWGVYLRYCRNKGGIGELVFFGMWIFVFLWDWMCGLIDVGVVYVE